MTALTFDSAWSSPRRSAVRRSQRVLQTVGAAPVVPIVVPLRSAANIRAVANADRAFNRAFNRTRSRAGLLALASVTIALHAAIIAAFDRHASVEPLPVKTPPLALEIAPPKVEPPPPPPVVKPKPLPQVAKAVPKPAVRPTPQPKLSEPVARNDAPVDPSPSPNAIPAAPAQAAPAPAPAPVERVTEPRGYAGYLNNPAPAYPSAALKRGLEGRVILKVHVLADGHPDNVAVARSSGHDILDEAAVKAVTSWVFDPARRGQTPIDGWVNVPLNFKLS
jgi:protein TonB